MIKKIQEDLNKAKKEQADRMVDITRVGVDQNGKFCVRLNDDYTCNDPWFANNYRCGNALSRPNKEYYCGIIEEIKRDRPFVNCKHFKNKKCTLKNGVNFLDKPCKIGAKVEEGVIIKQIKCTDHLPPDTCLAGRSIENQMNYRAGYLLECIENMEKHRTNREKFYDNSNNAKIVIDHIMALTFKFPG